MNWNALIRQTHRVISIAFTLTVIANFVALGISGGQQPPAWVTYSPLLPLFLLLLTGLYLFALPYITRLRGARSGGDPALTASASGKHA